MEVPLRFKQVGQLMLALAFKRAVIEHVPLPRLQGKTKGVRSLSVKAANTCHTSSRVSK